MLVINVGNIKKKNDSDWILIDCDDLCIKVKAKITNDQIRLVIDAPKNVKVKRENYDGGSKTLQKS